MAIFSYYLTLQAVIVYTSVLICMCRPARDNQGDAYSTIQKRIFCNPTGCGNMHSGKRDDFQRRRLNVYTRMGKRVPGNIPVDYDITRYNNAPLYDVFEDLMTSYDPSINTGEALQMADQEWARNDLKNSVLKKSIPQALLNDKLQYGLEQAGDELAAERSDEQLGKIISYILQSTGQRSAVPHSQTYGSARENRIPYSSRRLLKNSFEGYT